MYLLYVHIILCKKFIKKGKIVPETRGEKIRQFLPSQVTVAKAVKTLVCSEQMSKKINLFFDCTCHFETVTLSPKTKSDTFCPGNIPA